MQDKLILKVAALARLNRMAFNDFLEAFYEDTTEMMAKAVNAPPDHLAKMCGAAQAHTIMLEEFTNAVVNAEKIEAAKERKEARK